MNIKIIKISSEEALSFFESNSSGTVFHHPTVAGCLGDEIEWWQVIKGLEPFQLIPISKNAEGRAKIPTFAYYFGPYWSDAFLRRSTSSRFSDSQKINNLVIGHLSLRYKSFQIELGRSDTDVRPFLWWNYDNREPKLLITPRYSAVIHGLQQKTPEMIEADFRSVRRQEVKRGERNSRFTITERVDWKEVESGYTQILDKNNAGATPQEIHQALAKLRLLSTSVMAFNQALVDNETGSLASFVFILRAKGISNLVLAFTNSGYRNSGVGALNIREAIQRAKALGDNCFDFNGANSPKRGDDKHSYGASPALYFRLESM